MNHTTETIATQDTSLAPLRHRRHRWSRAGWREGQRSMWPVPVVELDNSTPIILSPEKSGIRGIRGVVAPSSCTRCSSSTGSPYVGAASRRSGIVNP
jgi:hypothetical protein